MNTLSREEFTFLISQSRGPCISLFLPTDRTGRQTPQTQIRLRNLLREAEGLLVAAGHRPAEGKAMLEPAVALVNNILFWRRQGEGLALFLGPDVFRSYRLSTPVEEHLAVADRFHLTPLIPLMQGEERFYVLGLSQNAVRLHEGNRNRLHALDLDSLPGSLKDALQQDAPEKQIRFRTGGAGGALVSGHGASLEDAKDNLLKYFRQIDRGLRDLLRGERAPLILAGVDYLFPIYREANTYAHLLEEGIPGNPEGMGAEHLHRLSWALAAPCFRRAEEEALAQYRQSSGTGLTSGDIAEIIPAAVHGRVGSLFLAAGARLWGAFDPEGGSVQVHPEPCPQSEELLDIAARQAYLNGGAVFVLAPDRMPEASPVAALFRY